ncbi:PREDICTED: uncharacterized protein LOC108558395 [Nicrophorus vespilloides]|uniref:Uncharacterized protein LOC108558395 n=1 Tax=Nicrophorus vespilloides TaxID=110193 RepID=A0ABM1M889_NICVS|nr:PREDICTED: uncharacterized protein LOC108558395 [Nicrophorus vespilloides]
MFSKLFYILLTIIVKCAFSENERFCNYKGCDSIVCNNTNFGVTISNCPEINNLKITKNRFTSLDHLVTRNVSIKNLSLEHINLVVIPVGIFERISVNDSISLANNNITEIMTDSFDGISSLDSLDLSNNKIKSLQKNSIPKAKIVNLNWNFIERIDESMFVDFAFLQELYLEHNCIKFPKSFHSVQIVRISYELDDENYCVIQSEVTQRYVSVFLYVILVLTLIAIILFIAIILVKYKKRHLRTISNEMNVSYESNKEVNMRRPTTIENIYHGQKIGLTENIDENYYEEPISSKRDTSDSKVYESVRNTTNLSYDKLGDNQNTSSYEKFGDQSILDENIYSDIE